MKSHPHRNRQPTVTTVFVLCSLPLVLSFIYAWIFPGEAIAIIRSRTGAWLASSVGPHHGWEDPTIFAGSYSDPNHPNCQRIIQVAGHLAALSGTDGNPGCPPDGSGEKWSLSGRIVSNHDDDDDDDTQRMFLLVDFSPKGGPANLKGVYNWTEPQGIQWPDGNKWTKITPS